MVIKESFLHLAKLSKLDAIVYYIQTILPEG